MRRCAFSLVEVVLGIALVSAVLAPLLGMFLNSHRIGHSARRRVEVTLHGQMLIEAVAELDVDDFPPLKPGAETILLQDGGPGVAGSSKAWRQVADYFARKPPLEGLTRTLTARRLPTGEVLIALQIEWDAVAMDDRTRQTLDLAVVSTPRNWQ